MEMVQYDELGNQAVPVLVLTDTGIYRMAYWLRLLAGCEKDTQFNPIYVMENVLPSLISPYNYKVIEESEWLYGETCQAVFCPITNVITIRSDVYNLALDGNIEALITIAHEVTHCIQKIALYHLSSIPGIEYKTVLCTQDSVQMQQHELQTDLITLLLFKSEDLFCGKTDIESIETYIIAPIRELICGLIVALGTLFSERLKNGLSIPEKKEEICLV